jgi:hypothetical protein
MAAPDIANAAPIAEPALTINPEIYSPIAHWIGDGDATDSIQSAKDYTLDVSAGQLKYSRGLDGRKAFLLPGNTRLKLADLTDKSDFQIDDLTVAFWIQEVYGGLAFFVSIDSLTDVDATDNSVITIQRATNGANAYALNISSQTGNRTSTTRTTDIGAYGFGGWVHIIVARNSGVYSGYINGEPMFTSAPAAVTTTPGSNAIPVIGAYAKSGVQFANGLMQSVMVWGSALTDAQQQAIVRGVGLQVGL